MLKVPEPLDPQEIVPLKVEGVTEAVHNVEVPGASGLGVQVTLTLMATKFAVIVPVPPIVAVVLADVVLPKVIDPVLALHDENKYPELGVAVSGLITLPDV